MKWSYIAGFVDGEGCFSVGNHGKQISLAIAQRSDQALVLTLIGEKLKANEINFTHSKGVNNTGCEFERIIVTKQDHLRKFILKLIPFLVVKRPDAEAALEFLAAKDEARRTREATCKYGHLRTTENTYIAPGTGRKSCLVCRRERSRGSVPGYVAP
jgi:hypothetical protein